MKFCKWRKIQGKNVLLTWKTADSLFKSMERMEKKFIENSARYSEEEKEIIQIVFDDIEKNKHQLDFYFTMISASGGFGAEFDRLIKRLYFDIESYHSSGEDFQIQTKSTEDCIWI